MVTGVDAVRTPPPIPTNIAALETDDIDKTAVIFLFFYTTFSRKDQLWQKICATKTVITYLN